MNLLKQNNIRYYFLVHSAFLCLLVGQFSPFKLIIDRYELPAILLIALLILFSERTWHLSDASALCPGGTVVQELFLFITVLYV